MLCYLALVWNVADPGACESAVLLFRQFRTKMPNWKVALQCSGLTVCCDVTDNPRANESYILPGQQGVIVGKLFKRDYEAGDVPASVRLSDDGARSLVASAGRQLIADYWGQYVAFLRNEESQRVWVLRDPTGGVPCYTMRIRGVHVYFRRFEDCEQLGPFSLTVNRRYVIGRLAYTLFNRMTGSLEITHVLPGECIEHIGDGHAGTFYWNPLKIANTEVIEDVDEATRLTRRTVRACIHAWASCYSGIRVCLSGGLDSSILLVCLKDAPTRPSVICENRYAHGSLSDERPFARLIARRTGFQLIEWEVPQKYSFGVFTHIPQSCEPFHWETMESLVTRRNELDRNFGGLGVTFTGQGGDELFFAHGALPAAADYMYRHGIGREWLRIALEDAQTDGASLWRVLRKAIAYGLLKRPWSFRDVYAKTKTYADSALCESALGALQDEELLHPLYRRSANLAPGKIWHAAHLSLQAHHSHVPSPLGLPDILPELWPLSSQPLMELSLRIPTYVLRFGGRDRSIARRAFAQDLPSEIVQRQWKATGDESAKVGILRSIQSARDLLLEGLLVSEGYLDRGKLREALLPEQPSRLRILPPDLRTYLDLEIWRRSGLRAAVAAP